MPVRRWPQAPALRDRSGTFTSLATALLDGTSIASSAGPYESGTLYPHDIMTCPGGAAVLTTPFMDEALYDEVATAVVALLNSLSTTCEATVCPRADFLGCVVRYAGHDLMDFRITDAAEFARSGGGTVGGSDGCVAFDDLDNRGLSSCLASGDVSLATAFAQFCDRVSLADFGVLASEALMAAVATDPTATAAAFKRNFMWGRTTATSCAHALAGLMPDPEHGCTGLDALFNGHVYAGHVDAAQGQGQGARRSTRCRGGVCGLWAASHSGEYAGDEGAAFDMGGMPRGWYLTAALSGAHTLGRAMPGNSGYFGWWSHHAEQQVFNNDYYKSLLFKGWRPQLAAFGNPSKNLWLRADDLGDRADVLAHPEMMLDTDLCLAYSRDNGNTPLSAAGNANGCCAWVDDDFDFAEMRWG